MHACMRFVTTGGLLLPFLPRCASQYRPAPLHTNGCSKDGFVQSTKELPADSAVGLVLQVGAAGSRAAL